MGIFGFVSKFSPRYKILMELSEKNSGGLFCLHTLPQFASSNWPVITNLKNTVDVRYDRAPSVPRRAGSGEQASPVVRNAVPKDARK